MTETTGPGYVYIVNWERYQHPDAVRSTNGMPWLKLYVDLLGNDDWLGLSPADRTLLNGLWMLTGRYGNGRVRADSGWLNAQLKIRKGSLERLNHAGFIEIRASKAASRHASNLASTEGEERSYDLSKKENARANGAPHGRRRRAQKTELAAAIAAARSWQDDGQPALEQTIRESWPTLADEIISRLPKPAPKDPA